MQQCRGQLSGAVMMADVIMVIKGISAKGYQDRECWPTALSQKHLAGAAKTNKKKQN